jgi:hypothetical protein
VAGYAELTLEQGANFTTTVTVNGSDGSPTNLLNYTGAAQMRKSYYANSKHDFTVTVTAPSIGLITMGMTAANTSNISPGRYVYDVEIENNSGDVTRIFEGIVTVLPNVTR